MPANNSEEMVRLHDSFLHRYQLRDSCNGATEHPSNVSREGLSRHIWLLLHCYLQFGDANEGSITSIILSGTPCTCIS